MRCTSFTYRNAGLCDEGDVTRLLAVLYDADEAELLEENRWLLAQDEQAVFLAFDGDVAVGVAHSAIRHDYVEGTDSGGADSRVGFLEGIYVEPAHRKCGVARQLLALCEAWAKGKGCMEFASDCQIMNTESYNFHMRIGFAEVGRVIAFAKKI